MTNKINISLLFLLTATAAQYAKADSLISLKDAQKIAFPEADNFIEKLIMMSPDQQREIKKLSGTSHYDGVQRVYVAMREEETIGYVMTDEVWGKHELITYSVAINLAGEVIDVQVLTYRESYGGEVAEPFWKDQFVGKTKKDQLKVGKDIQNISGATISTKHIAEGVRRLLITYDVIKERMQNGKVSSVNGK
jgi:Na+-translocating ferredoxin:NAD+ oxidoreductase RnfG subunit